MRTFVPDRTCWSLLLTALAIRLRHKPTYDKLRVLIINKDVRKLLTRKNGNENPIWSWNNYIKSLHGIYCAVFKNIFFWWGIKSKLVTGFHGGINKISCIFDTLAGWVKFP